MRIFGNVDDLPKEIEVKINGLVKKLEQIDYLDEISIYYGYPFIELDGKETIMKSCIICKKGIIYIYADDQELIHLIVLLVCWKIWMIVLQSVIIEK